MGADRRLRRANAASCAPPATSARSTPCCKANSRRAQSQLVPTEDGLYFSSDTPLEPNYIYHLDRAGTLIATCRHQQFFDLRLPRGSATCFFSTMVEPSEVESRSHRSYLCREPASAREWQSSARMAKRSLAHELLPIRQRLAARWQQHDAISGCHHQSRFIREDMVHVALLGKSLATAVALVIWIRETLQKSISCLVSATTAASSAPICLGGKSHLTFWHETPEENPNATANELGEYYMLFAEKADYQGAYDSAGIPQLDYHGKIGLQYNPIAIAQYGLGKLQLCRRTGDPPHGARSSSWSPTGLSRTLNRNPSGLSVWNHHFDWEYRDTLQSPVVLRVGARAGNLGSGSRSQRIGRPALSRRCPTCLRQLSSSPSQKAACFHRRPRRSLVRGVHRFAAHSHSERLHLGGLGRLRLFPRDTGPIRAGIIRPRRAQTLLRNLDRYDLGFWSLYEQSGTRLPMVASPFLSSIAHRAVADHASSDWRRQVCPGRRSLGKLQPQPNESHSRAVL